VVGILEIGFVLALALRRGEPEHAHGTDEHPPGGATDHAPAPLPGAAAASHH